MDQRLELHDILKNVLGNNNVYFQPPPTIQLSYPCIVYQLSNYNDQFANNDRYLSKKQYSVILIDRDPDTTIIDGLLLLSFISFDRYYTTNNLNHYAFRLYF